MGIKFELSLVDWLLDPDDAGARYLALRDLVDKGRKELELASKRAHEKGQIGQVLAPMNKEGYWEKPGAGYYPKYTGTIWSVILLAQLGASIRTDNRTSSACSYLLDHSLTEGGQFTINGNPSGTVDCMHGNLCASLLDLGCTDPRLDKAFEWMARTVTGEGIAPAQVKKAPVRYYAGKCGPDFGIRKQPNKWVTIRALYVLKSTGLIHI